MGIEIERKFLVKGEGWCNAPATDICQGYLNRDKHRTVRVRIEGDRACLTVKGISTGATRAEYEYPIPVADARELLALCEPPLVEKRRHVVEYRGSRWEVDEFLGANAGLVLAEIELSDPDQPFARPDWLGEEVTDDPRYFNSSLSSTHGKLLHRQAHSSKPTGGVCVFVCVFVCVIELAVSACCRMIHTRGLKTKSPVFPSKNEAF
jgi:adenylate cyclase